MTISGTCPDCGARAPITHFLSEQKYKEAVVAALKLPAPLSELVLPYMGLFAPTSGRAIRADKLSRVVTELAELIGSAEVTRQGTSYTAPVELWRQGLESVLAAREADRLSLPLSNNNYLCEIVWRTAAKSTAKPTSSAPTNSSHQPYRPDQEVEPTKLEKLQERRGHVAYMLRLLNGRAAERARADLADIDKQIADLKAGKK